MSKKRPWKSSNGTYLVFCVFHADRTPSLRVWPNGQFYCLGCKRKGKVKDCSQLFNALSNMDPEYSTQLKLFDV